MSMQSVMRSFAYSLDFLREQVSDLSSAEIVQQPGTLRNHAAWTIGHLSFACQMLCGAVADAPVQPWLPERAAERYGPGSVPVNDASQNNSKEQLLAMLEQSQRKLTQAIERLSEAQLDRPFPDPDLRKDFPTIRDALTQILAGHTAYHVGQVAVWRRALGLKSSPSGRSFE